MAIEVFNRKEIKYLITDEDKAALFSIIEKYMNCDAYNKDGKTYSICNLYLDTESDELIRKSLEKPFFKEKIRLRSYGKVSLTDNVFLESKKKFDGVVNKRRTTFVLQDAYEYYFNTQFLHRSNQRKRPVKKVGLIFKKVLDFLSLLWYALSRKEVKKYGKACEIIKAIVNSVLELAIAF